jgi:hypothetical protein
MFKNHQQTELNFELQQQLLARTVANMWLVKENEITRIINDDICTLFGLLFILLSPDINFTLAPIF